MKIQLNCNPIELPNIFYDFGQWSLRPESKEALDGLIEVLNDNPKISIELGANTDYIGSEATNNELSQKRAQSVVDYLIAKGVNRDRVKAHGYGESQPRKINVRMAKKYPFLKQGDVLTQKFIEQLTGQQQEIANQLNRRTEFKVLSTNYVSNANSQKRSQQTNKENTVNEQQKVKKDSIKRKLKIKPISNIKGTFYTIQVGVFQKNNTPKIAPSLRVVFADNSDAKVNRYTTGIYEDFNKAKTRASKIKKRYGLKAFVIAYKDGKRITLSEAKQILKK